MGSLHRFRDAVEHGWPQPLSLEEHSHAGMAARYVAGASGLPFGVLRGYVGTDLMENTPTLAPIACPFTGEQLTAVPALNPDVAVIHAQQADRKGNVQLWGLVGVQKEAVLAARRSIVTVEEVVDELVPRPNAVVLPTWVVDAVCEVPAGRPPELRHGVFGPRQRVLPGLGRDQPGSRSASRRGSRSTSWAPRTSPGTAPASASTRWEPARLDWSADDVMIVNAARCLSNDMACFVGIGLPSTAATWLAACTRPTAC